MADASREEKLAAARKKLQKFQKKKTPANSPAASSNTKSAKKDKISEVITKGSHDGPVNGSVSNENSIPPQNSISNNHNNSSVIPEKSVNETPPAARPSSTSQDKKPKSSAESLRQLSRQLNGLMTEAALVNGDDGINFTNSSIKELEDRNQELAAEVDIQTQSNKKLLIQIEELQSQCKRLQQQLEKERTDFDRRMFKEQSALKEQLQVHIQTIGILVAEKSELQSTVNQSQTQLKQKKVEADNLSSRLQASRQRVAELERSLSSATSSSHKLEKTSKDLDKERDSLKLEVYKLRKSTEELSQQNSELQSRLESKFSENSQLEQSLKEFQEKLKMSELRAQQLSSQHQQDAEGALQTLTEEKTELEGKLAQYAQAVQQLSDERQYLSQQYQDHINQLQQHAQQLADQINSMQTEKEGLIQQQEALQKQVQDLQHSNKEESPRPPPEPSIPPEELQRLQEHVTTLEEEKANILAQYQAQINDNRQLGSLYQEKEAKIEELENTISRLKDSSTDTAKLLESVQNDKATISRAVAQNKELKVQLEELQDAFVKMSESNMENTTKMQSEQHIANELRHRLEQQEQELKDSQDILNSRDFEIENLKTQVYEMNKELMHQAQLADRAHHYAAQEHFTEIHQRDLANAQGTIRELTDENSALRSQIAKLESYTPPQPEQSPSISLDETQYTSKEDMVDSLSAAIRQLEMERDHLRASFIEQEAKNRLLQEELSMSRNGETPEAMNKSVTQEAYETMELAMEKLQERFSQVFREKVDLMDKCQELEHVNLQLTGETETIGEYITLYHNQRNMIKKRQEERERYMTMLAGEKESMQEKLNQLQNLVMQLLQEKRHLIPYPTSPQVPAYLRPNQNEAFRVQGQQEMGASHVMEDIGEDWPSSDETDSIEEGTPATHYLTANNISTSPATPNHIPEKEHTAHQIIQLLQQMGGSNIVDRGTILDRDFLPCKCCSGVMIDV